MNAFFYDTPEGPQPYTPPYTMTSTDGADLISLILREREKGVASTVAIWSAQYGWNRYARQIKRGMPQPDAFADLTLYPLDTVERVGWIVDPARQEDLGPAVMGAFRTAARLGTPLDADLTGHLPPERASMLTAAFNAEPRQWTKGSSVVPEQMALMFHLCTMGAARKASLTAFRHPTPGSAVNAVRRTFHNRFKVTAREWDWDDAAAQVRTNTNGAQRAPRWWEKTAHVI